ncbi:MAG: hypothetical protein NZ908_01135 [Candidatus Micrarchaeota archaeon]|nr:hypothetical protein [Candidatus Micrarchaeota archaeon]
MKDYSLLAAGSVVAAVLTVSLATIPKIDEIRVKRETPLGITVEYKYPSDTNRSKMLGVMTSGASMIFRKEEEGWALYVQNPLIIETDRFGFSGKVFLPNLSPNTPYFIVKNNYRKSKSLKGKVYTQEYGSFTVFSEKQLNIKERELLRVLDEHLELLSKIHSRKIFFRLHLIESPIPSTILNPYLMVVGNRDRIMELVHEFAHVYSTIHNREVLEAAVRLFRDPERFAEYRHFRTEIGHPSSNLSETIASMITIYVLGKDIEMDRDDREAFQIIVDFYRLDELRKKIHGIISTR